MILSALLVIGIAIGIAMTVRLGRAGSASGIAGQVALALPFLAISSAVGLRYGMGLTVALIASLSVALAVVAPALLPKSPAAGPVGVGRAAATWVSGLIVAVALAALLLSWAASIIEFASPLNRNMVVIVLAVAAAGAAGGAGAGRVWSRILFIGSIVVGVLMVVGGFLIGDPGSLTSPVLATSSDGVVPALGFGLAVIVLGAGSPGLRAAASRDRRSVVIAGIVMALVTALVLIGLLMMCGGWITKASFSMFVLLAFMPGVVGAIIAGVMALLAVLGVSRSLADAWTLDEPLRDHLAARVEGGRRWVRPTFRVLLVVLVAGLAIAPVPQVGVALIAVAAAVIRIVANRELTASDVTEVEASSAEESGAATTSAGVPST